MSNEVNLAYGSEDYPDAEPDPTRDILPDPWANGEHTHGRGCDSTCPSYAHGCINCPACMAAREVVS